MLTSTLSNPEICTCTLMVKSTHLSPNTTKVHVPVSPPDSEATPRPAPKNKPRREGSSGRLKVVMFNTPTTCTHVSGPDSESWYECTSHRQPTEHTKSNQPGNHTFSRPSLVPHLKTPVQGPPKSKHIRRSPGVSVSGTHLHPAHA